MILEVSSSGETFKIRVPEVQTCNKYGLTRESWLELFKSQDYRCPVCGKRPKTLTPSEFNIDHRHVPQYGNKSEDARRRLVRGIVCQWDNRSFLAKGMTIVKARNLVTYLGKFEVKDE